MVQTQDMGNESVRSGRRLQEISQLRNLALKLVNKLCLALAQTSGKLVISTSALAQISSGQNKYDELTTPPFSLFIYPGISASNLP
jgi:hypothetical protein